MDADHSSNVRWVTTNQSAAWVEQDGPALGPVSAMPDVFVQLDQPQQTIEGFGACFNELGWTSLAYLSEQEREGILHEMFAPGVGGNFSMCRMPVGANDFSRDWYSYDETPGDLELEHFNITNDFETLIPFIHSALKQRPDLKLWASPWSPPTWMKVNGHYAAALPNPFMRNVDNGLRPDQVGVEGTDMFIQEEAYFRAYAAYFGRFIDAYREQGIQIGMVMPQNEFNSTQMFPSCTWTPEGLRSFIAWLAPEMSNRGVELFLGTLERPNERLATLILDDPQVGAQISGVGLQWAGKGAAAALHYLYPQLRIYQSEQECGDGKNDWRYCRYAWTLMKHYFNHGATAYFYWNISLKKGGISRWGWAQNSLVTVDEQTGAFCYNHEYYLLKHASHFVQPGAVVLKTLSYTGFENQLAFLNPDGRLVVLMQNDMAEPVTVHVLAGGRMFSPVLPADSFNTFVLDPAG